MFNNQTYDPILDFFFFLIYSHDISCNLHTVQIQLLEQLSQNTPVKFSRAFCDTVFHSPSPYIFPDIKTVLIVINNDDYVAIMTTALNLQSIYQPHEGLT